MVTIFLMRIITTLFPSIHRILVLGISVFTVISVQDNTFQCYIDVLYLFYINCIYMYIVYISFVLFESVIIDTSKLHGPT